MKKIIIIGATSGIGREMALIFIHKGWKVGIAGRRKDALLELQVQAPQQVEIAQIDVTKENSPMLLLDLIQRMDGIDVYLHVAGIGKQNRALEPSIEESTLQTNALGFTRMVDAAFNYFRTKGGGQIAAISSIAGVKGLGVAPSYSATKRFQNCYLQSLAQLSHIEKLNIKFTDIRPGFVDTDLLNDSHRYPMLLCPQKVATQAVNAILRQKRVKIIDFRYRLLVFFWKLIPNFAWEKLSITNK